MKEVKGLAGIYFKSSDPERLKDWYKTNLGITGIFKWRSVDGNVDSFTLWNVLPESAAVFNGTKKDYVISYWVADLGSFLEEIKDEGIQAGRIESDEIGKFSSISDPEGNKVILRESNISETKVGTSPLNKVTGLGGVFFKSADPKKLNPWYGKHLGLDVTEWGCNLLWHDPNNANEKSPAMTVWNPFAADTTYFNPSKSDFMFNYRVLNLVELLKKLEASGVPLAGDMQEFSYGKFGWIVDPDGNKIELWESIDD